MHAPVCTEALMVWSRLGLLRRSLPVSYFHLKQMTAIEVVRLPRRPQQVKLLALGFLALKYGRFHDRIMPKKRTKTKHLLNVLFL
jgi:hypothetical protein